MDTSIANGGGQQELANPVNGESSTERARECLLGISQADPAAGFSSKFGGPISKLSSTDWSVHPGKTKDEDNEFRQNLISISYVEPPIENTLSSQPSELTSVDSTERVEGEKVY